MEAEYEPPGRSDGTVDLNVFGVLPISFFRIVGACRFYIESGESKVNFGGDRSAHPLQPS